MTSSVAVLTQKGMLAEGLQKAIKLIRVWHMREQDWWDYGVTSTFMLTALLLVMFHSSYSCRGSQENGLPGETVLAKRERISQLEVTRENELGSVLGQSLLGLLFTS